MGWAVAKIPVAHSAGFFCRDTSTMINRVNKLERDMERDRDLRQTLHALRAEIRPPEK